MIHVRFLNIDDIKPALPASSVASITRAVVRRSDEAVVRLGSVVLGIAQAIQDTANQLSTESDTYLARAYQLQHADTLGLSDSDRVRQLNDAGRDEALAGHVVAQRNLGALTQEYLSLHYLHAPAIARRLAAHPSTSPFILSAMIHSKDDETRLIAAKSISSSIRKMGIGQTQTQVQWLNAVLHATRDRAVATQLISVCVDEATIDTTFYRHSGVMGMPAKHLGAYLNNPYTPDTVLTTIHNSTLLELTQEGRDAKRLAGHRLANKQGEAPVQARQGG